MGTITGIIAIVVNIAFYLVLFAFMLRMLFQLFKANSTNPFAINIVKFTNPAVLFLREYLPRTRYIDLSTLVCWIIIDLLKYIILSFLTMRYGLTTLQYIVLVPADFIMQLTMVIFWATLFYVIINFVAPGLQSVGMDVLKTLSEPALKKARKLISPDTGFDFAPIIVLVLAKLIQLAINLYIPADYFI